MTGYRMVLALAAAAGVLAGCERPSAVASKAPAEEGARPEAAATASRERASEPARRVAWSASRRGTAEENARRAFERNGEAFGARDLDDFVRKANAFIDHPPAGTERLTRANGDVLLYDPKGNVFAVAARDGVPRTMFRPDEGAAYWAEQKTREDRRQAGDR